jgi:hypothetical protein
MILRNEVRPVRRADKLAAICEPIVLDSVGSLTSHNPIGLHVLLRGQLYFFFTLLQSLF